MEDDEERPGDLTWRHVVGFGVFLPLALSLAGATLYGVYLHCLLVP